MSPRCTSCRAAGICVTAPAGAIGQLVHQQVVADQQRVFHGAGRDDEGLHESRGAEEEKDNGDGPFGDEPAMRHRLLRGRFRRRVFYCDTVVFVHCFILT